MVYNKPIIKGGKRMNFKFSKRISGVKASAIREILKMMNDPEYYKKYSGWSTASIIVNDGSDWYAVRFY